MQLRLEGKTYNQIVSILGCSKGTVSYHLGKDQKEATRDRSKLRRQKAKRDVLNAYGKTCKWCGFDDIRALHIDHIDNNGSTEVGGWNLYVILKARGYPEGYQTLCANCNSIKQWEHAYAPPLDD